MKEAPISRIKDIIFENGAYKLVALFVTLILWMTLMSRRDFEENFKVQIEYLLPKNFVVQSSTHSQVKITVEGPRAALRQLQRQNKPVYIDMTNYGEGRWIRRLNAAQFNTPSRVKIVSIEPQSIEVELKSTSENR